MDEMTGESPTNPESSGEETCQPSSLEDAYRIINEPESLELRVMRLEGEMVELRKQLAEMIART